MDQDHHHPLRLHRFRYSAFCEKVRLILTWKGLDHQLVEVTPGVGQLALFRLSGQRQVPVLVDGTSVIADSTAIALHLEQRHPTPPLLPTEPRARARVLLLEDWADTALATAARLALLQAAAADSVLRTALLPEAAPAPLRGLLTALPAEVLVPVSSAMREVLAPSDALQLQHNLESLSQMVTSAPYLDGERLSLADLAVAAQLGLLRFPASAGEPLAGRGVDGIADSPLLEPLFRWRDAILAEAGRR
ncbi:MAG: glutathione S-transferase [Cyanobacteriota bacterium]|nr:glutathione S-transferase [Cyanobacteriota bacterium]